MGEGELLDIGSGRRSEVPRRVRVVVLVALLVVGACAFALDRGLRDREERAVASCADQVEELVDLAGRRIRSAYEYVRPALSNGPEPALERGLYGLIANSARGADTRFADASTDCRTITVLPLHTSLRDRRDRCVDVLEAQRRGLAAVSTDGTRVMEWLELPRSC